MVEGFEGAEVEMATNQKSFAVQKTEEEWRRTLTPEQYYVLREHGTERRARVHCCTKSAVGRSPAWGAGSRCS